MWGCAHCVEPAQGAPRTHSGAAPRLQDLEGRGGGRRVLIRASQSLTPQMDFPPTSASPKAAEAARLLLSDMWSSKELQGVLRQVSAHC